MVVVFRRLSWIWVALIVGGCPDFPTSLLPDLNPGWFDGAVDRGPDKQDIAISPDAVSHDAVSPDAVSPDAVSPDTVSPDTVSPPPPILIFNTANWTYHSNYANPGHPQITNSAETTLIPDNCFNAGAALLSTSDPSPPFAVELEFSIYDNDGGSVYSSADGIAFMFGKNRSAYGTPPIGPYRGVIVDGSGYSVHFSIYGTRQVILADGWGTPLKTNSGPQVSSIYTHGQWKKVRVEVRSTSVKVHYDGALIIDHTGTINATTHKAFGFGAGTGAADGRHSIRNVRLLPLI